MRIKRKQLENETCLVRPAEG